MGQYDWAAASQVRRSAAIAVFCRNCQCLVLVTGDSAGDICRRVLFDLDFSVWDYVEDTNGLVKTLLYLASYQHVRYALTNGEWIVRDGQRTWVSVDVQTDADAYKIEPMRQTYYECV